MLFFDVLYGGPIADGFGFLVTLFDRRNPFRETVRFMCFCFFKSEVS